MRILKSLVNGIGALPVDFKGAINKKPFIIKVQFKIDGSAAAQIWSDQKVILEVEGVTGEQNRLSEKFLEFASKDEDEQEFYKKTAKDFIAQLHKEVKDYNRKKGIRKKAIKSEKPVQLPPSGYYLFIPPAEGQEENWFLKKGLKSIDVKGFPKGRFVVGNIAGQGKYVFDTVHGFSVMPVNFGLDEVVERINQGLSKQDDPEKFLADHAAKVTEMKKKMGTWKPKPSLSASKSTTTKKAASKPTAKRVAMKKATPKKVTAKKATAKKVAMKKTSSERQYGSSNLEYDRKRSAKRPGKRRSASGIIYYEYRKNKSDKSGSNI